MAEEIKVETGIPAPPRRKYPYLYALNPGESVLVRPDSRMLLKASIQYVSHRYGRALSMRTQPDGSVRVWRIK